MDRKQIEYFVAIAKLGSFRRASEILHIAQPALTRQMKRLERTLGVDLFERRGRSIVVTEAGRLLLERGQALLDEFEQTAADVAARGSIPSGTVRLGAASSIARVLFVPVSVRYRMLYPNVEVRLYESVGQLWNWLSDGKLDIAVLPNCEPSPNLPFQVRQLVQEQIYLVGPGDDPQMPARECSAEQIVGLPLIISSHPNTARKWLENYAERHKSKLNIAVEVDSLLLQHDLVAHGLGYALLPHCAVAPFLTGTGNRAAPVKGLLLSRTLAWRSDRPLSPALNGMIQVICAEAERAKGAGQFGTIPAA